MISAERFNGIRTFVQVVEAGSFIGAARQLGLSPSSVGKAIARLEQRLDVRLFHRTTRSLSLTDEGLAFHESCIRALDELQQAEAALAERRQVPTGRLRIALPDLFGRDRILPVLLALAGRYPELAIDAVFSNRMVDFAEEGFDLAVRIGALENSPILAARRIGRQALHVCAAPAYLAQRGAPDTPAALAAHVCIGMLRDGQVEPWRLRDPDGKSRLHPVTARLRLGHHEAVLAAAKAGHGLAQLPAWRVADELARGELVTLLDDYQDAGLPIHVIWPATRRMTARLRVVIDALCADAGQPECLP